jgi:FkbM family methyltransferase
MDFSLTLDTRENEIIKQKIQPFRPLSLVLNVILTIVICVFVLCSFRFLRHDNPTSIIENNRSLTNLNEVKDNNNQSKRDYYDFEPFMKNITLKKNVNQTRRYYYIDLGCFDGRDVDYFIHFHLQEISRVGNLTVIAFEPDPINLSACKTLQERHTNIKATVYNAAVWTENGKVRYTTEKGQKSKIDLNSQLHVRSIDFSQWLLDNFRVEDYIYVKFSIEGAEIPVLEKMIVDESLALVDYLEIEWNDVLSPSLEPRRVALECMFDNFGMDFLYMISPIDLRHGYNVRNPFQEIPKDRGWYVLLC